MDIVETAAAGSDSDHPVVSGPVPRKAWATPRVILSVMKQSTAKIQDLGDHTTASGSTPGGAPGPVKDFGS